ncbi:glycosyltransferase family 4 protein [Spirosoma pollinicola]|uniref:Glycosyltransferase family 1 protein n=1 Tax=Spirosoma pollinicola TaxID=2057025 RepID=A0A2K8Z294_9BACT|nr:glycosyltransferase family 1 protein [Spirosoma pollinicola]AUD03949.1 glycosyltransferase family 1 protein [Spirosoma pollinicola]
MKVLFDHQSFTGVSYGGVSRYFFELMRSFTKWSDIEFELSLRLSNNEYLDQTSFSSHLRYRSLAQVRNVHKIASVLNRLYSLQRVKAGKFDVFHPTYYHKYFLDAIGKKPFVLTFHDATSERYGKQYPEVGEGLYELKKQLMRRADSIISVSEFSKQEILRFFPIEPEKIKVIPLGTTLGESISTDKLLPPLAAPYLLYVGKRGLYKNFDGFFRAAQPVLHRHPDLHIICAGGGAFNQHEQGLFYAAGLTGRMHYRPVDDTSLLALYKYARAFVFPSLNEGFGIPVLEAFSGGCAAVLSNRSSLPEVGADAALYFDPENDDSIADAIERIVTDDALNAELRQKGTQRLLDFSCDKTASQTLEVYQSLC